MLYRDIVTVCILLTLCVSVSKANFTLTSFSVTPDYAKSVSSDYTFTFTAITPFNLNFELRILFPSQYPSSSVTSCSFVINNVAVSNITCSRDNSTNQIIFKNLLINQTITTYTVRFFTSTARYSTSTAFTFRYYNQISGALTTIQANFVTVRIRNAIMGCSVVSGSPIVGATTNYNIFFTPIVDVEAATIMQLQLTPWGPYTLSNFITTNISDICGSACSVSVPASNNNAFEILRYTNSFTTSAPANNVISFTLNRIRNPASTQPITITVILLIKVSTFTQSSYMNCSTTLGVSQPNTFNLTNFDTTNKVISATNVLTLNLRLANPIANTSYIRILSTLPLTYRYDFYNVIGAVPTQVTTGVGVNELLINNLTPARPTSTPTNIVLKNFTLTNPPYSNKPITITFTTQNLVDTNFYLIDRSSVQIISQPSTIVVGSVSALLTSLNVLTTYTILFSNINPLIINSFIYVVVPTGLTTTNATCSLVGISNNCSIFNSTTFKAILANPITAATNVTYRLVNFKNPSTTTPTDSFKIYTYYEDQLSLVDKIQTGLTIQATSVPLKSVQLVPSSINVGAIASYTLSISFTNDLPASSSIQLTIPLSSFPQSNVKLTSLKIAGGTNVTTCTFAYSANSSFALIILDSCFATQVSASQSVEIILSNITNPSSTKPTDSWTVRTFFNSFEMQYLLTGIIVTMTNPIALNFFQVTPKTLIANQLTNYTFQMTSVYRHYTDDRILLVFPSGIFLSSGFTCNSLTTGVTLSCSSTNQQNIQVRPTYTITNYTNALTFIITNIRNNWFASTRTISVQTTTNDTSFYYVESGTSTTNFQPSAIITTIASNNQIILTGISVVSVTIQSPYPLSLATNQSLVSITLGTPSNLIPKSSPTCTTSFSSASCTLTSSQLITITNLNDLSSPIIITFTAQTDYFTETSPFDSKIIYNGNTVATNTIATLKPYCTAPCKQCGTSPTNCLSCLQSPNTQNITYIPDMNICVSTCPSLYFLNGNQCDRCSQSSCLQCVNSSTKCTQCQSSKYLLNNSCLLSCPSGYFKNDSLRQCLLCDYPCLTCSNSTVCISCVNTFNLDLDFKCVSVCTNSSYLGVNGVCVPCIDNCLRCSGSVSTCTSCDTTQYTLFNSTCTRICPLGYYKGPLNCQLCVSPCLTCSSSTLCVTCLPNYFLYQNNSCSLTCPSGTLPVINKCQTCAVECATCTNLLTNCSSCSTGKYFYFNSCVDSCPLLTYPYNRTCTTCISPCVTCTSSPSLCLSCVEPLLLLNQTCVEACPPNGYYKIGSNCIQCQTNCLSCDSPVNCLVCSDGYNQLDGGCISECPTNNPIVINRKCMACESQCASCSITAYNCTSCKVFYFSYLYTCVQSCPITYYSNVVNYKCEDGLASKISFFPILIMTIVGFLIIVVAKIVTPITSFFTVLSGLMGILELSMWIFLLSTLYQPIKQPNVNYMIPSGLLILAIVLLFVCNGAFFYFNSKKIIQDKYLIVWCTNSINYYTVQIFRFGSLTSFKLYRIVYSRIFSINQLSAPYHKIQNAFRIATIFTIISLFCCQVIALIAAFTLAYTKLLKDQIFYTSVECIIVTVLSALASLMDIWKNDDFFQENDYVKSKKYIEKVNDSGNNLEDNFEIQRDQGSVYAEKCRVNSSGKLQYSRRDPNSFNSTHGLFFEEDQSIVTDAVDNKMNYRINIFNPIIEQQAQYYDQEKYQDYKTEMQKQLQNKKNHSEHSEDQPNDHFFINGGNVQGSVIGKIVKNKGFQNNSKLTKSPQKSKDKTNKRSPKKSGIIEALYGEIQEGQEVGLGYQTLYQHKHMHSEKGQMSSLQRKRELQFGFIEDIDDNKSLLEYRDRKKKWNSIISKRQKLADQIFGNRLQKIDQPADEDQREEKSIDKQINLKKRTKRKKKKINNNDELEKIYLQRLTEKTKKQQRDLQF